MKYRKAELRKPFTRSIVFALLMVLLSTGCSNFEHPLPWSHSPLHGELAGSWYAVHESEPPMPIEVTMNQNGSLSVDMAVSDADEGAESDSTKSSGSEIYKVTFQGDVLSSNDVHVLQIDMNTYKEHKRDGSESDSTDHKGYRFLLVDSEGDSMTFQQIDIEQFAYYAEAHVLSERTTLTASEFASCIDSKIRIEMAALWMAEMLKERPTNWLSEQERSELEQSLKEFESRTVDPYYQLRQMRECIAYELPGDVLGRLFTSDPARSFSGESTRIVKVQ